jgi:putative inorganic carbon (hco3(-)) transporter
MIRRTAAAPHASPLLAAGLIGLLATVAIAVLVSGHDAPVVLAGIIAAAGLAALLVHPPLATVAVVFLIYINAPAVAVLHGIPKAVAGAVVVLLCVPLLDRLLIGRERARWDRTLWLMFAFLCVMLLASLGAPDKAIAADRLLTYATEGVLLYWLIINVVTTRQALRHATWALLAAGVFLASLSIYQAATRSYDQQFAGFAERKLQFEYKREADLAAGADDGLYRADRAEGPQIGNNRYAQIMLVLIPLAALHMRRSRQPRVRVYALVAGVIILVGGVALTYSRGGLLALAVLGPAALMVGWLRPRQLIVAGAAGLLLLPVLAPNLLDRVASLSQVTNLSDQTTDGALRGRATEMLAGLHAFADHPLLGVGPGQYEPYYSETYQQTPGIKFRDIQKGRRAHSLYIEMAAETGIIGLLVFLAIPFVVMRLLWRGHRRLRETDAELADTAAALWLGLIAFLLSALFLSHAFERYYWLIIALAGATLHLIAAHERAVLRPAQRVRYRREAA